MKVRSTHGISARSFKAFNTATTSGLLYNQMSPPKRTDDNENEMCSRGVALVQGIQCCDHLRTPVQPNEPAETDENEMRNTHGTSRFELPPLHNQMSSPKWADENESEKCSRVTRATKLVIQ